MNVTEAHHLEESRFAYAADRPIAQGQNVWDPTPPPFDIIGDIHGCIDELHELLTRLGYHLEQHVLRHPAGRRVVFLGDLNDRGPGSVRAWQIAVASVDAGTALYVPGNHDSKFARYLMGRHVQLTHGMAETAREFLSLPEDERYSLGRKIGDLLASTPPYRILDGERLVVAHAGLEEWMIGRTDRDVSAFARFGERTGEHSRWGFPIRRDWAADYHGETLIVYGHTPVPRPEFRNNTINIDQGCAFGGALTALRYPERTLVSVPAHAVYAEPSMAVRAAD